MRIYLGRIFILCAFSGIADRVEEQISELYLDFNWKTRLNIGITIVAVKEIIGSGYKGWEAGA